MTRSLCPKRSVWVFTALALGCCLALSLTASASTILNASFEQPSTSTFIYNPVDPTGGWTFSGRSGVAATTFFIAPPPDGTQAAFIQQFVDQPSTLSSISQSLSQVSLAPSTLSFYIAQRSGFPANPITVLYGAQNLGTFTPASTAFSLITINFTPASTSGALTFRSAATTSGDIDTAIDLVTFAPVNTPEPGSFLLLGSGLAGIISRRRHTMRK